MNAKHAGLMGPSTPAGPLGGVRPPPAPGLRGKGSNKGGMAGRMTYAPMNTNPIPPVSMPPADDPGKLVQPPDPRAQAVPAPPPISLMNKLASRGNEVSMGTTMAARPLRLQDMLKTAMAESSRRVSVGLEAARQLNEPMVEKTASADIPTGKVDSEYALKLASAIEYIATEFDKEAEEQPGPGHGPGALHVMQAESSGQFPPHQGQGHNVVPMHTGLQAAHQSGGSKTQVPNDQDRAPGGPGTQQTALTGGKGKIAFIRQTFKKIAEDEELEKKETEGMDEVRKGLAKAESAHEKEKKASGWEALKPGVSKLVTSGGKAAADAKLASEQAGKRVASGPMPHTKLARAARAAQVKLAEDAINPAHISAGAAVAPDTSASGESGGQPVGGAPQGPSSLVGSNESAINYKRNQAYGGRKTELKSYFNEPALTMSTDKTLSAAFDHTSQAGTKFASAGGGSTKVAAARAILSKLAEEAEQKSVKDKGEKQEKEKVI